MVAIEVDLANPRLLVFGDVHVHDHLAVFPRILTLHDVHLHVLEALAIEIFLDERLCAIHHIGRDLMALAQTELCLEVFAFALFHAVIVDLRDTWALLQADLEPHLIALDASGQDLHVRKQPMLPEAPHRVRDLIARDRHLVANREAGEADEDEIVVVLGAGHLDAGDGVAFRRQRIGYRRHLAGWHRIRRCRVRRCEVRKHRPSVHGRGVDLRPRAAHR